MQDSLRRIMRMVRKEFIQAFRDPRMRAMIFIVPIMQMLIMAPALTTDVRDIRMAVVDLDRTTASRDLVSGLEGSHYFRVVARPDTAREAHDLVDRGKVQAVLEIHAGFADALGSNSQSAGALCYLDGTESTTAAIAAGYVSRVVQRFNTELLVARAQAQGITHLPAEVTLRSRAWFNEELQSSDFYIPALVMMLVTVVTMNLTAMAIVRERELGTIEQILVTPIRRFEFILGKTLPFAMMGFVDAVIAVTVAIVGFHTPFRGNPLTLSVAVAAYIVAALSIGLFISTVSRTQQQAMLSTVMFILPAVLLSGYVFPVANMPDWIQWCTLVNPLRHMMDILRAVLLRGVGLDVIWPHVLAIAGIGAAVLTAASVRFRKTLA
ncbi:MAG: ABC transporter permease [Planctomycetota bacterium]